jgi:hypothetical protein
VTALGEYLSRDDLEVLSTIEPLYAGFEPRVDRLVAE